MKCEKVEYGMDLSVTPSKHYSNVIVLILLLDFCLINNTYQSYVSEDFKKKARAGLMAIKKRFHQALKQ